MNKHVETEQEDKGFQLFGDGTMLIKVDGVMQRRKFDLVRDLGGRSYPDPEVHAGEEILRTMDGGISIISVHKPVEMDVGFGKEEIHPLARLEQLAEAIKQATPFNTLGVPPSTIHAYAREISELVAKASQQALAEQKPPFSLDPTRQELFLKVDASEAKDYVAKMAARIPAAISGALELGWRAYIDAPLHRDMGRSKFNAGAGAAIEAVMKHAFHD